MANGDIRTNGRGRREFCRIGEERDEIRWRHIEVLALFQCLVTIRKAQSEDGKHRRNPVISFSGRKGWKKDSDNILSVVQYDSLID